MHCQEREVLLVNFNILNVQESVQKGFSNVHSMVSFTFMWVGGRVGLDSNQF